MKILKSFTLSQEICIAFLAHVVNVSYFWRTIRGVIWVYNAQWRNWTYLGARAIVVSIQADAEGTENVWVVIWKYWVNKSNWYSILLL